jgi:nucleotide-binding universal stress UspA family protein
MNIVIPSDLSLESESAVLNLVPLLTDRLVKVTLYHCVESVIFGGSGMINISDILVQNAERKLNELGRELSKQSEHSIEVDCHTTIGQLHMQLSEFISSTVPDFVIIPSIRKRFFDRLLVGQRSLWFIGELSVPTLIVPFDVTLEKINVGLAMDQREGIDDSIISELNHFSGLFESSIKQFHIDDLSEDDFSFYLDSEKQVNDDTHVSIVQSVHIESGIKKWCANNDISVLAMVTHPKSFIQKNFVHSTIRHLVKENELSILILTKKDKSTNG